jgi:hypothetical protein
VGWCGSDAQFSYVASALAARHESLWQAIVAANGQSLYGNGSLHPLAIAEKYALFDVLHQAWLYKALLLGLTLGCIAAFAALVRAVAGETIAWLSACTVAAALPLQAFHDADLANGGMAQLVLLALLASLGAWRRAVLGRNLWAALLALALYAAAGLTCEIAYLFFPLYACVVRPARSWLRACAGTWPFALVTLALGATSVWLRAHVPFAGGRDYHAETHAAAWQIARLEGAPFALRVPVALAFAGGVFALLGPLAGAARAVKVSRALVALALFAIADLTAGTNAIAGTALRELTASQAVVERAFARGLARDVPPGATIVLPRDASWVCEDPDCPDGLAPTYLLYGLTGRRYLTVAPENRAYANVTAFRLTYATGPEAATVTLERGGAAPVVARYRERAGGAWSLSPG